MMTLPRRITLRVPRLSLAIMVFVQCAFVFCGLSFGQYMQAIPPDTPDNLRARADKMEAWLKDWPNLGRYRDADAKLAAPAPGEMRVVFMGDSITDGWRLDQEFPGKPYVDRGISGQTTAQMVLRFHQDVIALRP